MSKKTMRLWSVLLVFVMIFNMLPLNAMALEAGQKVNSDTASRAADDTYIIGEVIENRTEYTKEFIMSNGFHLAAVYDNAVHYQENGQWKEIDNTLKLATTKSGNTYVNTAGVWQVSFPQKITEDTGISITKDGYVFIFRMAGELLVPNFQDVIEESEIIKIPAETEKASAVEEETTPAEDEKAAVSKTEETEPATEAVQKEQETEAADNNLAVVSTPNESVIAEIAQIDMEAAKADAEYPETVVEKINSRLSYEGIYEDTDIIFDLKSNQVKESIVMKEYREALKGYVYTLEVGDMIPVLLETGEIELRSADGEEVILYMPAPYLIDDAGTACFDINVSLEGENGKYILAYELPQEWLSDEARQWPVILDPAVQPFLDANNIQDRAVCRVGGYAHNWGTMLCGYYGSNEVCRIYLKYNDLPALSPADIIVKADMQMRTIHTNYNSNKATPVMEVHKVKAVWDSRTINWTNKPDFDVTVEDYAVTSAEETFYNWDVTDLVRGWYEGENTGMMFKMSDTVEAAANVYSQFYSADYSFYLDDLPLKPTLTIVFRNNNGLESYWGYTTSSAGRAGTGYVNQYSGNLV